MSELLQSRLGIALKIVKWSNWLVRQFVGSKGTGSQLVNAEQRKEGESVCVCERERERESE